MKSKTLWKTVLWVFLLTIMLQICARNIPGFGEWYAVTVYPLFLTTVSRLFSILPFSVAEFLLYGMLIGGLVLFVRGLICCVKKKITVITFLRSGCTLTVFLIIFLLFGFTITCGINYHRTPFSEREGWETKPVALSELEALCRYLGEEVTKESSLVQRGTNGVMVTDGLPLRKESVNCMQALGKEYDSLSGYYSMPKPVTFSSLLSYQETQGIYTPFTIEANYNRDIPDYNLPHTICHELSHLKGFMREDEANFIAFLACRESEYPEFRYSGAMTAFVYSTNALYKNGGKEAYREIVAGLPENVRKDFANNSAFWKQYKGPVAKVANKVNDTYLKMNAQEDGVKSYGRMVDLLLSWHMNFLTTEGN